MADAAPDAKPAEGGGGKAPKAALIGKLLPIIFAVINLVVVGGGAFLVYFSTMAHEIPKITDEQVLAEIEKEKQHQETTGPVIYTMDKFTANLDGTPTRVIQTEIALEMLDEEGFEEVVTLGAKTKDSILRIINSRRFSDIETIQGKLELKDMIRRSLNAQLRRGVVKDVYFTQLTVQ